MNADKPDVWVGVKRCGCPVAVVVEMADKPKETEKAKRDFLRDGLSVVRATWEEWEQKYLPRFMHCKCAQP